MKAVYICTKGEYSDYSICGVFDDKKLAEKFCEKFNNCRIEKWNLNPFSFELKSDYSPYFIRMTKEGKILEVDNAPSVYSFGSGDTEDRFDVSGNLYVSSMAKSQEHAIKITNDRRAKLIALNQWGKCEA